MRFWLSFLIGLYSQFSWAADKPELMLLQTYQDQQNIQGWLVSEKLDGVRGVWDGKTLRSRQGNVINAPQSFLEQLPPFALDGELWAKRSDFESVVSIVRQSQPDKRWKDIQYHIFEVPNQAGGLLERLAVLQSYLQQHSAPQIHILPQIPLESVEALEPLLQAVIDKGGEGLVIRDGSVPYQTGRLSSALKVKKYQDTECKITQILPGLGQFTGQMGSVECEMMDGKKIKIGSGFNHQQRREPPAMGTLITFKYYGLTEYGKPRFPVFLRVRDEP